MPPSQMGLAVLLGLDRERAGLGWVAEMSSLTPGTWFLLAPSLVAQMVKNLPAVRETWVQSLGWKDPLEKERANHSSILVWKIP